MKLRLKTNGREMEVSSKDFETFSHSQKAAYTILDKADAAQPKVQVVTNTKEKEKGTEKEA